MKRGFILVLFLAATAFAFAQSVSIGGGVSYGPFIQTISASDSTSLIKYSMTRPILGFHAFVDATYIQFDVGYGTCSSQTLKVEATGYEPSSFEYNDNFSWLDVSLVGKYPTKMGSLTVFPFAGIEYLYNLSATDSSGADLKPSYWDQNWLDAFLLKLGVGADIPLSGKLYLRPELFGGLKLNESS